ncbi:GNAT family N-acetyltransferase [Fischerella sp. PCC 9605]|uniref:GNAT family N-acetyltransferase n=1 Tax=Fischerella sp. PCC 9605 TaxID=1173024 RepID=UPI00047AA610|nr:GNAT family N-acetyltransferase [Fischerella sp. PCC 9605]
MLIKPLSPQTLDEAINLVDIVFPYQSILEKASLRASLFQDNWLYKIGFFWAGVSQLKYWVAIDENSNKVIGITGLYCYKRDEAEANWLGWLCVDPLFRGQGIGKKLLEFAINKTKATGKKFLRLYTSTDPNEATAQTLYEKYGFHIIREESMWGDKHKKIYRQLQLCSHSHLNA